jgi:hypothetical protein
MSNETPKFALTIWAPWAQAIVRGPKLIENRTWKPHDKVIGERIAIHCGKTLATPADYDDERVRNQLDEAHRYMVGEGVTERGCIIGTARVVGYAQSGILELHQDYFGRWYECTRTDMPKATGDLTEVFDDPWWTGPVGWLLDDVRELAEPVPTRGVPGVWTIDDEVREMMEALRD